MEEETRLFLEKLKKLQDVWLMLKDINIDTKTAETIEALSTLGKSLNGSVRAEGSLNAGGKFEWVNSILIKVNSHN